MAQYNSQHTGQTIDAIIQALVDAGILDGKIVIGGAATRSGSTAIGDNVVAIGYNSHAEGQNTNASGKSAHAEGCDTYAVGDYAHAEGRGTIATPNAHAQGKWNVHDGDFADVVGNGNNDNDRKNISALTWTGDLRLKGDVYTGCADDSTGGTKMAPWTVTHDGHGHVVISGG